MDGCPTSRSNGPGSRCSPRPLSGALGRGGADCSMRERWRMHPEYRAILERMRSSAGVVRRAVEAAPPGRFGQPPREGEWSALETLTHLRDVVVHVYGLRIRRLL